MKRNGCSDHIQFQIDTDFHLPGFRSNQYSNREKNKKSRIRARNPGNWYVWKLLRPTKAFSRKDWACEAPHSLVSW